MATERRARLETPSLIFLRLEGGETLQPMLLFVQSHPTDDLLTRLIH